MEKVFPGLVAEKSDRKTLAYDGFIPINTRAIQEIHDIVKSPQKAMDAQQREITGMQQLIREQAEAITKMKRQLDQLTTTGAVR